MSTDTAIRQARQFAAAQAHYDNIAPPELPADDAGTQLLDAIGVCEALIGRAERAICSGDFAAARDLLIEAAGDLAATAQEVAV
jgi:hypothetical protein